MIHHYSIAARNPAHVASVLAEILGGRSFPFNAFPGSHIVVVEDGHGTAIEVCPAGQELSPGKDREQVHPVTNLHASHFSSTHAAISVEQTEAKILSIGTREGWRALTCDRGPFRVVEFWVENRLLIEFLTPDMVPDYLKAMEYQRWIDKEKAAAS